jgi:predicted metalloendopeptidase
LSGCAATGIRAARIFRRHERSGFRAADPPEETRADTVRNLDAWYDAFDVRPGQRLYLEPSARVRVW